MKELSANSATSASSSLPELPSQVAVLSLNNEGIILDANQTAQAWFGQMFLNQTRFNDAWLASQDIHLSDRDYRTVHTDVILDGSFHSRYIGIAASEETRWVQWQLKTGEQTQLFLTDVSDLMHDIFLLQDQAEEADTQDFSTKLYNRRYAMERLEQMHHYAKRYQSPFAVAMIDIDHFKRINDTFGHNFGDQVLARLAQVIKRGFRETDLCARFGGEEFLVLMPETETNDAILSLDRLRQQVSELKWDNMQRPVTISSGVIAWQPNKSIEQLIFLADQRLSTAKKAGRNQVCGDLI